ncbi:Presequence protease, mitochondrial [Acipenser ruthenus]|uniref:Pitrilysin metalloproteinase 1 n=1 Tax=Acipenser ruthenus TaxID=7906 RepID=A0A662YVI6_ACIRT|nr:Presequence protease, mitochondrial [Acipenser ruthenus]
MTSLDLTLTYSNASQPRDNNDEQESMSVSYANFLGQKPWRFNSSSAKERALLYKAGEKIHGFTVNQVTDVPDLFLTAVKLTHDNTGARYLHVARDDSNNLFSVQFRTTPMDSTGVPHILEHTVLCGSEKFPCRDPFFKMLNRSLSTFMNAFTASDYTMYPFSTQNGKDFQNLLSVYLDAVFFPCLRELDFWQEGWRLEHENPTDPNAPLVFKGVVFNEMKGSFREHHVTCGPDSLAPDPSKQNTVCVSYLLGDITDTFEAFTLNLLSSLMVTGPNSPFYKALIEAKIGTDFSSVVGFDGSIKEASFSVGMQGIAEKDIETVKEIIFKTVNEIIANGFEEERIEALLHKIEIQMKHQSTSFGLSLACDNPHRLTLSMSPDESYFEKQAQAEEEKLKQKVSALSEEDKKLIYEKGKSKKHKVKTARYYLLQTWSFHPDGELMAAQSTTQDASCLPALKVSDILPTIPFTPVEMGNAGDVPVQYCAQPTNGMVYFRAMCSLNTLPEDLKIYVPLFCNVITKLGCGVMDYRQQSQQIELKTGGMSVSPQIIPDATDLDVYEQGVLLSSSSLERNVPDMMRLWSEIINTACFDDEERLRVLVMMSAQELANGIPDSGHTYAMIRAARNLTPAGDLQETFDGMDQVNIMKRIAEMSNLTPILRKFPRIKKHLFNPENMRCAVNATPQMMSEASLEVEKLMNLIARKKKERKHVQPNIIEDPTFKPCQMKTYFQLPFPVNYVSECIRAVPFADPDYASLQILARLMTAKFLHGEIREKGGAYGGGAKMGQGGLFAFYSYRDPNSIATLTAFRKGVEWAKAGKFTQQDIDEAKLSVFSAVDAPIAPSNKGISQFLNGIPDEMKQKHREQLFAVTHKSLVEVANKYLGIGQRTCGLAILGPPNESINKNPSWVVR